MQKRRTSKLLAILGRAKSVKPDKGKTGEGSAATKDRSRITLFFFFFSSFFLSLLSFIKQIFGRANARLARKGATDCGDFSS